MPGIMAHKLYSLTRIFVLKVQFFNPKIYHMHHIGEMSITI